MVVKMIGNPFALLALVVFVAGVAPGLAQAADTPELGASTEDLFSDLLHYIKVARPIAAQSYGRAILDSGVDPQEIYLLSVKTPGSMATLAKGARLEGMAEIVEQLGQMISKGYEADRSDPERIAHSIEMLGGTLRAIKDASDRLVNSGEYALPQLIQALRDPDTTIIIKHKIALILPRMGKDAVRGLSVALQTADPKLQEFILAALAEIGYPHAVSRLTEFLSRQDILDRTRRLAQSALVACSAPTGEASFDKSVAEVFYDSALKYYYGAESVLPDARYDKANVWYWDEGLGLTFRPVPIEIFNDVYAMRMTRLALQYDPTFHPSVSLWLSSYLRRQANLPPGQADPLVQAETPSPRFFALASPATYLQDVLSRAMKDRDSAVALGAIEALAKTAGAKSLVQPIEGGAMPLAEAMSYPDRQVRYLAALSLAEARPTERFRGSEMVMATLSEALRQKGTKTVLLVAEDPELRNSLKDAIRGAGHEVIDEADPLEAMAAARAAAGVDVAVLTSRPHPQTVISRLRAEPVLSTLPVVVISDSTKVRSAVKDDERVMVIGEAAAPEQIASALDEAGELGVGKGLTAAEAAAWVVQVCRTVRMLGQMETSVYDIGQARPALIEIVRQRGSALLPATWALAAMNHTDAQTAIAGVANDVDLDEETRIEAYNALSESVRRFGNLLTDEPVEAIIAVVGNVEAPAELREASAQALGVLSLPSEKVMSLILESGQID